MKQALLMFGCWLALWSTPTMAETDSTSSFDDLLIALTEADLSLGWLTHQDAVVAGISCRLLRVSFAGELGWEVHGQNVDIPALYAAITGAGAKPFGMYALNSMRIEKGYRAWGQISGRITPRSKRDLDLQ